MYITEILLKVALQKKINNANNLKRASKYEKILLHNIHP
jgi:hypothetical protein